MLKNECIHTFEFELRFKNNYFLFNDFTVKLNCFYPINLRRYIGPVWKGSGSSENGSGSDFFKGVALP
jgi:hypothetical protein